MSLGERLRAAEHQAARERIKELEAALRVVVAESEMHRFGTSGYDLTLDHLHDVAVAALAGPGCEHRSARPDGNGMALCDDCDSYLLPFMTGPEATP